jgi:type II secretory ATPase GspE/PulE/Tfp pilus assembly ATPase PilB-like protein
MSESLNLPSVPSKRSSNAPVVVHGDDPAAMISLQERLIERAIEAGASDLHIEPYPERVRLRIRVDGWLYELDPLPRWMHGGLVSRIKVLAEMDVTERRRPQDGRAVFRSASGETADLRIATAATQHGEKVVVRILPQSRQPPDLQELGLDRERLARVARYVEQPCGLILTAGPTGAGKTTTLYAMLRRINAVGRNVVTLEDPIEYTLANAVQMPVRRAIGFDFAAALRAVLRQDPDVILVGEIRDEETARIAVRSATTGHLVLSSVHTNSAAESIFRLFELGVPEYLVATALTGVVSQRLVRRLCRRCRVEAEPSPRALERLGMAGPEAGASYFTSAGCPACTGGFDGRVGIFETLTLEPELRGGLTAAGDCLAFERRALSLGALQPLRSSAIAVVRAGETSLEEVARVLP